jgi:hypothetical protein
MANLTYIIGEIPRKITFECEQKFEMAKFLLESKGFEVINPLQNLVNPEMKFEDAHKLNIKNLIKCKVVYVLPSVSFENVKNAELLLAIKLNKLIIQDSVFLNEEEGIDGIYFCNLD